MCCHLKSVCYVCCWHLPRPIHDDPLVTGDHTAAFLDQPWPNHAETHQHLSCHQVATKLWTRALNGPSQRFHNHGEGPSLPSPGWNTMTMLNNLLLHYDLRVCDPMSCPLTLYTSQRFVASSSARWLVRAGQVVIVAGVSGVMSGQINTLPCWQFITGRCLQIGLDSSLNTIIDPQLSISSSLYHLPNPGTSYTDTHTALYGALE